MENTTGTVSITTTAPAPRKWQYCASCGDHVTEGWQFCPACGQKIGCLEVQPFIYPWVFYPLSPYVYPATTPQPITTDPQWTYTTGPTC